MPLFALANTAVKLGGGVVAESIAPAAGIGAGLLIGEKIPVLALLQTLSHSATAILPAGR